MLILRFLAVQVVFKNKKKGTELYVFSQVLK